MDRCMSVAAIVLLGLSASLLQGCGAGNGANSNFTTAATDTTMTSTVTSTLATTTTTTTTGPIRGIAYGALPKRASTRPSPDMVQSGYEMQWGARGRNDLQIMKTMGANTVRLYHSFGVDTQNDHSAFLDHAEEVGLKVMPGVHSNGEEIVHGHKCGDDWDCFDYMKTAIKAGLEKGFQRDGAWHSAVSTLILLNEPDFLDHQICHHERWCSNKIVLSAFDALLVAEKEAGINGTVAVTTCFSLAGRKSLDGLVSGPGVFGFQDVTAIVENPNLVHYTPRSSQAEIKHAFDTRWHHCLNIPGPWSATLHAVEKAYQHSNFGGRPWFVGEHAFGYPMGRGQDKASILSDIQQMTEKAQKEDDLFLGFNFFQFQTAYEKNGDYEKALGMFGLTEQKIGDTDDVCTDGNLYWWHHAGCAKHAVYCLSAQAARVSFRAEALAEGFGGQLDDVELCGSNLSNTIVV